MGVPPPAYESHPDQSFPQAPAQHHSEVPFSPDQVSHSQPQPAHAPSPFAEHAQIYQPPQAVHIHDAPSSDQKTVQQTQQPAMAYQGGQQMGGPHPVPLASLLKEPNWVQCPSCAQVNMTRVEFVSGTTTHLWAAAFCCCLCLGCIPYCVSGMKNVEHHCSSCGTLLATYKRGSGTEVNAGAQAGRVTKH